MTPRFVFRPAARAELLEARDWYDAHRDGLGREFAESIDGTIARIGEHPELYPEVWLGLRRAVLLDFPYAVFYRLNRARLRFLPSFILGAIRGYGRHGLRCKRALRQ